MRNCEISPAQGNRKFLGKLKTLGIEVSACYQCGRCSAGCPVSEFFDLKTMEVVRLAAYGMEESLLASKTIWLCAACDTCATRCPNGINITLLMDTLRELALRKGVTPAEPRVPAFHAAFLDSVRRWGRTYEVGMLASYKLRSGDLTGDMKLGVSIFAKGKLSLLPHRIDDTTDIHRIFAGKGKEYER